MTLPHKRLYEDLLKQHIAHYRQMAFIVGPRQVGKTTLCKGVADPGKFMNWDNTKDRSILLAGTEDVGTHLGLHQLHAKTPVVAFDELHKYRQWKSLLKGLFDTYSDACHILVTGSSRLDAYRRGSDSMMGRYFIFHLHPFSTAELIRTTLPDTPISPPGEIKDSLWHDLWTHGGFPEPLLKHDMRFTQRWQDLRHQQLVREDIRDLTRIQDLGQMETLVQLLASRSGSQLTYSTLAGEVRASVDTIRRWIDTLTSLHYGFLLRPWFKNVSKSLTKEPKWYLRDWSSTDDIGARSETFVACHLLKAVDGWNDRGLGRFELRYLRDKQQREVDFIVIKDNKPWFLVEAKHSETTLSPSLRYYQEQMRVPHAFQVVIDLPYEDADCFKTTRPTVVPARTLLSQLL